MKDKTYIPTIHSAQIYPYTRQEAASLAPAVISLDQEPRLLLTFDDLQPDTEQYQVRIIHCNWSWEPSRLTSLQYLFSFNEFPVTEYEFSQNTFIPYVHYQFLVPKVKIPGNYVLAVYRNNNPEEVVLTRRFMVYTNQVGIEYATVLPSGSVARRENQQIDFSLNYSNLANVNDPSNQFKVVIRQNRHWENAKFGFTPSSIEPGFGEIEYHLFDQSNQFKGGNEYRFFDLRTVRARGQNVGEVLRDSTGIHAYLVPNESRAGEAYSQIRDLNGWFHLTNLEYPEPPVSSEYVNVHFFLEAEAPLSSPVYVAGGLTNYNEAPPYRMRYDAEAGGYLADLLLKQGWYNYMFLLGNDEQKYALEGSFAETENLYEIIVYYRPPGEIYDTIVGYAEFTSRER
ncbi:type IX secretion system plug protein [Nafulsella turpanensis]|uniref:type IX secretion system plug protein n=1 Tax=Nafulsella turpanensis TaxID=1265690 RepID=UPI000345FE07|nr:DUF5103 domain-containing protein [Nafulsella turpanensis]